jgi:hypothetical protein
MDSFIHLISDNITGGVPVHNVRRDVNNPNAELYQANAINVKFLVTTPGANIGHTVVEIAVLHEDELVALSWVKKIYDILNAAYVMTKLDYTNPLVPVPVGSAQIWWPYDISFVPIHADGYYDFRCNITLYHPIDS